MLEAVEYAEDEIQGYWSFYDHHGLYSIYYEPLLEKKDMNDITLPDNNPKSAMGLKKAPTLSVIPASSQLVLGQVMALGAAKYGRFNWREKSVAGTVYTDAIQRHLIAWMAGQDNDPESGVSHLGHIMACACILIDAIESGNLVDDRSKNDHELELLERFTKND